MTTGEGAHDTSISWFPDSERILFIRRIWGFGIYQVRVDGAMDEQFVLLSHKPALSPDGRRVAHQCGGVRDSEIRIYDMETGTQTVVPMVLPPNSVPHIPVWVGPKRLLVTDVAAEVYLVDIATGRHEQMPMNTHWVRAFDPAHPRDVSAVGKRPFTWGWLKSLGQSAR